jgi:hypothetical protein
MKITLATSQQGEKGYVAMLVTFMFLGITIVTLTSMWLWTVNNNNLNQRNNTFNQSQAAAEAATEKVFTTMNRDFLYGNLNTSNQYNNTLNNSMLPDTSNSNLWPVKYIFSDTNGHTNVTFVSIGATNFEVLNSQYAGLKGISQDCTIISVATPLGQRFNVPATVNQTFQAAIIPVFQFAIFYNLNLEIAPGHPMDIVGPVFCNQNIWEGSQFTTFESTVQAVGTNDTGAVDPFASPYTPQSGGPTFVLAGQPTPLNHALIMPIGTSTNGDPTNVEAILNLPPAGLGAPNSAAYALSNQVYLYNESDLIISNAPWGTNGVAFNGNNGGAINTQTSNITIWFQDPTPTTGPILTKLTNDMEILKLTNGMYNINPLTHIGPLNITNYAATNILYAGFSFVTNVSFMDWRESDTVQAVQIDIAKFRQWLTNQVPTTNGIPGGQGGWQWNHQLAHDTGHNVRSIYVYNSVPFTAAQLPAARLINGAMLPTNNPGLTVSTPMPLYIYGDYNISNGLSSFNDRSQNVTSNTFPAAVMADAITVLSTNWSDSITNSGTNMPTAGDTTVNAAMLEGIVQSFTDSGGTAHYSGGVENFLRMLEDWGSNVSGHSNQAILTYNGSIVVMFPSIYATNLWGNSSYYGVPQRQWAFDLNFETASGLPPLSPSSRALVRGNWSSY